MYQLSRAALKIKKISFLSFVSVLLSKNVAYNSGNEVDPSARTVIKFLSIGSLFTVDQDPPDYHLDNISICGDRASTTNVKGSVRPAFPLYKKNIFI